MPYYPVEPHLEDSDKRLWRYMSFPKFISLLHRSALYFTRADHFQDKYEGAYPLLDLKKLTGLLFEESKRFGPLHADFVNTAQKKRRKATLSERQRMLTKAGLAQLQRTQVFINCWHINEYESAAMWDLYARSDDGIAIQSSYKRIAAAVEVDKTQDITLYNVQYLDYETDSILKEGDIGSITQFISKRKSFEHEREARAIIVDPTREDSTKGMYIDCDLNALIEAVYVAPTSPGWYADAVEASIQAHGRNFPVRHSTLANDPIW